MKNIFRNINGITLISLVITIAVMLIIAGITVSVTMDNGIFDGATNVKKQQQEQSIIEAVKTAEATLETEQIFEYDKNIDISSLMEKVKEVSDITDDAISIDAASQSATIVDEKTGVVVDVTIGDNGDVIVEGIITDDVSTVVKPVVSYTLDPLPPSQGGEYAETVTIILTAQESTNGISKIKLPNGDIVPYDNTKAEITYNYRVSRNGTYRFIVESAIGRSVVQEVKVTNAMEPAAIVLAADITVPTSSDINVVITYDANAKIQDGTLKYQYSTDKGKTWRTVNTSEVVVLMATNGEIRARYYDGIVAQKTNTLTINNIDKLSPKGFNLTTTVTTNSITVTGNTTDNYTAGCAEANYGISGYQFRLKNEAGKELIGWTTKQESGSYTFSNLTQGINYKVSMRAIDKAGNITEVTNKDYLVSTLSIDSAEKIGISYSETNPTNKDVTVTFKDNSGVSGLTLKYQIGSTSGTWQTYSSPIPVSENKTIYARLYDTSNQHINTAVATVANIDKVLPTVFILTENSDMNIVVTASAVDTELGMATSPTYNYYLNGTLQKSTTDTTYTIVRDSTSSSNVVKVTVQDKATNLGSKEVTVSNGWHGTHTDDCYNGTKHASHTGGTSTSAGGSGTCYETPVYHQHTGGTSTSAGGSGTCYATAVYHTHTGNTTSGGACFQTKVYHQHSGSSTSGGGCYTGKNYHQHSGSSTSGGGCYTGKNYHQHSGSSTSGGGCYTGKNYHSHSSSCVNTKGSWSYTGENYTITSGCTTSTYRRYKCSYCGELRGWPTMVSIEESITQLEYSHNCTGYVCGKTTSTVESYYVNCGKTAGSTVDSYYVNCGKTAGSTVDSYYVNCGKTAGSTVDSYQLSCTKTTSTIDSYKLSCTKTPGSTIDSYSLSCTKTLGAYYMSDGHTHSGNTTSGGACYTAVLHQHSGSTTSGGACYQTKNLHKHTGSTTAGGGCYQTKNYHSHTGNSTSGGGCYTGKNYHSHSGSSTSGGGCYTGKNYHSHSSSCVNTKGSWYYTGETYSITENCMTSTYRKYKCSYCGEERGWPTMQSIEESITQLEYGHSCTGYVCGKTTSTVESYYINCGKTAGSTIESYYVNCGKTAGTTVDSYALSCGKTTSTVESYSLSCGKTTSTVESYSLTCGKSEGTGATRVYATCSDIVTKIEPVVATQNVERARIDFNIKVTYLDGHSRIISPTSTTYNSTTAYSGGSVTLKYTGNITKGGSSGTLTTTMTLTTKD